MIAGTGFRLSSIDEAWPRYERRARRSLAGDAHLAWVVQECRAGQALCLECDDGMVVLAVGPCEAGTRAKALLAVGEAGALRRREDELAAVAREIGAAEVSFRTDRPAWRRMLSSRWKSDGERFWRAV